MKIKLWVVVLFLTIGAGLSTQGFAFNLPEKQTNVGELNLTIEPIVGYEFVHLDEPTPHVKGRVFYGARVTGGIRKIGIQGEYTQSDDDEVFSSGFRTREKMEKAKLGLIYRFFLGRKSAWSLRAGGQASKRYFEQWRLTTRLTSQQDSWIYRPYVGGGLNISIGSRTSLVLDGTVVVHDPIDLNKNEYQGTAGISYGFYEKQ